MTIPNMLQKCKDLGAKVPQDVLIVAILIVASIASFGLGFLAGKDTGSSRAPREQGSETSPLGTTDSIPVVASKSGTKYYLPGCAGVDKITVEKRVWFINAELARAQGYELASNCKEI